MQRTIMQMQPRLRQNRPSQSNERQRTIQPKRSLKLGCLHQSIKHYSLYARIVIMLAIYWKH